MNKKTMISTKLSKITEANHNVARNCLIIDDNDAIPYSEVERIACELRELATALEDAAK